MKKILLILSLVLIFGASAFANDNFINAAYTGNLAKIQEMLNSGVDINATDEYGNTALMYAISEVHIKIAKLLIEKGIDVNAENSHGKTALGEAFRCGFDDIIKLLIEKGVDVNAKLVVGQERGQTALSEASSRGYVDIVKLLIDKGCDIHATTDDGYTVLHSAAGAWNVNVEIIKLLIEKGVAINAKDNYGRTALMHASYDGRTEVVNILKAAGAR